MSSYDHIIAEQTRLSGRSPAPAALNRVRVAPWFPQTEQDYSIHGGRFSTQLKDGPDLQDDRRWRILETFEATKPEVPDFASMLMYDGPHDG